MNWEVLLLLSSDWIVRHHVWMEFLALSQIIISSIYDCEEKPEMQMWTCEVKPVCEQLHMKTNFFDFVVITYSYILPHKNSRM